MMASGASEQPTDHPARGAGLTGRIARLVALSLLLGWLPLVGQVIAGAVSARGAAPRERGVLAAVAAALWVALLGLASGQTAKLNGTDVALRPLLELVPALVGAAALGCLAGAASTRIAGAALLVVGLAATAARLQPLVAFARVLAPSESYKAEKNKTCPENLKQLHSALMLYADSWDGKLPPAEAWMTAIRDNVPEDAWMHCPDSGKPGGFGYAFNKALGGACVSSVKGKATTPLLYDSSDVQEDATDNAASLPRPGRHTGRNNVLYLDGHVEQK